MKLAGWFLMIAAGIALVTAYVAAIDATGARTFAESLAIVAAPVAAVASLVGVFVLGMWLVNHNR